MRVSIVKDMISPVGFYVIASGAKQSPGYEGIASGKPPSQ
jgi:hypothetical protein